MRALNKKRVVRAVQSVGGGIVVRTARGDRALLDQKANRAYQRGVLMGNAVTEEKELLPSVQAAEAQALVGLPAEAGASAAVIEEAQVVSEAVEEENLPQDALMLDEQEALLSDAVDEPQGLAVLDAALGGVDCAAREVCLECGETGVPEVMLPQAVQTAMVPLEAHGKAVSQPGTAVDNAVDNPVDTVQEPPLDGAA